MILLNFAHPLIAEHMAQIECLTGQRVERVIEIHTQIDPQQPLVPQVTALVDQVGLSPAEWQTLPLLVNPPSLNFIAVALLAELHGRCGYFPAHLRMRRIDEGNALVYSGPPRYEVAEILDLQAVRDLARRRRGQP
ncbi:MAG: CRISPR-associated protein Csx15 [Anaerolineae bacterium]|nr:CRISPR-associated protein Csx15 [Anaerolineae bacterium]MDW8098633.1 CRISPR-associated protein Csx15 [Anaerolineae bacterium]